MEQNKREPGCTCVHGTPENPVVGGYAQCSIHAPWARQRNSELLDYLKWNQINSKIHVQMPEPREEFVPDSIVQSIIQKFKDRAQMGEKKYDGANLDREDLSFDAWVEHAQQELMDGILYLEKLKKTKNGKTTTN